VTATDLTAVIAAALVVAFVIWAVLSRTKEVPPSPRATASLAVATGLCGAIVLVAVPVVMEGAGTGDPSAVVTTAVDALLRPVTWIGIVLSFDAGFATGFIRERRARKEALER
jgi:predicted PurR-regulated permease PerM